MPLTRPLKRMTSSATDGSTPHTTLPFASSDTNCFYASSGGTTTNAPNLVVEDDVGGALLHGDGALKATGATAYSSLVGVTL